MMGIVDVGGGMRGVFGCGVTDFLLDNDITFDYCLGVSAGGADIRPRGASDRRRGGIYCRAGRLRLVYPPFPRAKRAFSRVMC